MDEPSLRGLRAVADNGSFTTAAEHLGVSQPALSRRVSRLEDELGRLLDRHRRGVELTVRGRQVLDFADRTLAEFDALRAGSSSQPRPLSGTVTVAASTTPGEYLVPDLVGGFSQRHPAVTARIEVADSAQVFATLSRRAADVGFSGRRANDPALAEIPVARDEVVLAVPAGHALAEDGELTVDELAGQRLVGREEGSATQRTFLDALAQRGLSAPMERAPVTLNNTQAILAAVDAGLGLGVVPLRALEHHRPTCVTATRVAGGPILRDLYMVYEPAREYPGHVAAFLDFAAEYTGGGRVPAEPSATR
jgi:DNA-binding transcriptional LysR family regulator